MNETQPFPLPEIGTGPLAPFWQAAQHNELHLPRCRRCGRIDWYPTGTCRGCGSDAIDWQRLSGAGTVFSWCVVKRALDLRLAGIAPYVSAIVTLAEDAHSRLVTRLVAVAPEDIRPGMTVAARFVDLGYPALSTGVTAPLFAPT